MMFQRDFTVSASMCDKRSQLGLIQTVALIEDVGTEYLASIELDGLTTKRRYGAVWVYVRNNVRVFRCPKWLERITVRTGITQKTRATVDMQTEFFDESGNMIVCSKIELCAIDVNTGRIRKVESVGLTDDIGMYDPLDGLDFSRITADGAQKVYSTAVRASNTDFIGHTNNVEYLRFLADSYAASFIYSRELKRIQIDYVSQSFENDVLDVYRKTDKNTDVMAIKKGDKDVLRAVIEWD